MSKFYSKPDSLEDIVQDADIIVQGNVQNAREYMETFQAIQYQNAGIDPKEDFFFDTGKNPKNFMLILINAIALGLFIVVFAAGGVYAKENEFPLLSTIAIFGCFIYLFLYNSIKTYCTNKTCTTQIHAPIIGKNLYQERSSSNNHWRTVTNTFFLVEYLSNLYILCERNDRNYYGEIGDTHPILINPDNPFIFCTEEYKNSCFREFLYMLGFIIVAVLIVCASFIFTM